MDGAGLGTGAWLGETIPVPPALVVALVGNSEGSVLVCAVELVASEFVASLNPMVAEES